MLTNQNGGSRTDTLIKFILVFFISLLSFSVGTFVGKQFSDSQHRLAQLETDYDKSETEMRETASIPSDQLKVEPDKALTEEDVSKLTEDVVAEDSKDKKEGTQEIFEDTHKAARKVASKDEDKLIENVEKTDIINQDAKKSAAKKSVAKSPKADSVSAAAEKVSKGEAPANAEVTAKKAEKPKLPNTVAPTTVGKYTVQIAAQPSEESAKTQSIKLKDQGFSAFYVEGEKAGKKWYRVNIGLFQNRKDATDYQKKLAERPEFKGAFVKEIVN